MKTSDSYFVNIKRFLRETCTQCLLGINCLVQKWDELSDKQELTVILSFTELENGWYDRINTE